MKMKGEPCNLPQRRLESLDGWRTGLFSPRIFQKISCVTGDGVTPCILEAEFVCIF